MSVGINLLLWTARLEAQDAGGLRALPDLGDGGVAVPSFTGNAAQARQGGDHLHRLADVAQERGASVIAGPMNLFELLVLTPEGDAASLLGKVNIPNHHNLQDTVHAPTDGTNPVQVLRRTQPALADLHLSENHRGNLGSGHAALVPAVQRLKAGAYDQRISVEALGQAMPQIAAATRNWPPPVCRPPHPRL